jgi:hypothetical protein
MPDPFSLSLASQLTTDKTVPAHTRPEQED